jgi:hypothetical protein
MPEKVSLNTFTIRGGILMKVSRAFFDELKQTAETGSN